MARGAIWMVAMRWAMRSIGLINTIIIARLLTPDDFGVVAMGMIVFGFLYIMTDANVDTALLRDTNAGRADYDSAWTLKVITGAVTTACLWGLAPLMAYYYGDERVTLVVQIIALRAFILGFENIGVVEFRRDLDFAKEFRYWVARRLSLFVFSLVIILILRNYMALALAAPLSGLVTVVLSYTMSPYRPRFDVSRIRPLWSFSKWMILYQTTRFMDERADEFIIGGVGTAKDLGSYNMASGVAMMTTSEVVVPMSRALVPTYAKIAHDPAELRRAFLGVLGFVAIICFSAGVGMSVVAEDLILVLLGDQWEAAVPLFRWLAIIGLLGGLARAVEPYLWTAGHERSLALANTLHLCVLLPTLVWVGNTYPIEMIAISRMSVRLFTLFFLYYMVMKISGIALGAIVPVLWRPIVAAVVMAMGVQYLHDPEISLRILSLLHDVVVGALLFASTMYALWILSGRPDGAEKIVMDKGSAWLSRRLARNG